MAAVGSDTLLQLFGRYLYFLDREQVGFLVGYCEKEGFGEAAEKMRTALSMTEPDLLSWIGYYGDEEDIEPLVNVFLWKQREGLIRADARVVYAFKDQYRGWTSHRYMIANGYPNIEHLPMRFGESVTTYAKEIDRVLDLYEHCWENRSDEDADFLATCLSVIGPNPAKPEPNK